MNKKINILTRTSNRPKGFEVCANSIINQTYKDVNHVVAYDNEEDLSYIDKFENITKVKIDRQEIIANDTSINPNNPNFWYSPHNLYCNSMLDAVEDGWVMFLDDDDMLIDEDALEEIAFNIKDEDTIIVWQMRYPTGMVLPDPQSFVNKQIRLGGIGSPCFLFHSKWKDEARWDAYKCGDFRFLEQLYNKIPNKKWVRKPYIQLNNNGGFGKKQDI